MQTFDKAQSDWEVTLLFIPATPNKKITDALGIKDTDNFCIFFDRMKGFIVAAEKHYSGTDNQVPYKKVSFGFLLSHYPTYFIDKDMVNDYLENPFQEPFSVGSDWFNVEPDGCDSNGYPSITLALGLI